MKITLLSSLLLLLVGMTNAKDYYVAINGSNSNAGSQSLPFATINKAASVMLSGDVCYIDEGFYPETITPTTNNITFKAIAGKVVEVSGFNQITSWTQYQDNVYVTNLDVQLDDRNQLLFDGQMMNLARWPDKTDYNPFNLEARKAYGSNTYLSYSSIPDQNWSDGGVLFFLGKNRWTSWRTRITDWDASKISFNEISLGWEWGGSHNPSSGGEFFLQNTLEALDSEGEWYVNRSTKQLYFWAPNNLNPNIGEALVKGRINAFVLDNRSGITIEGLHITGANISLKGASDCVIKYCDILYGNHTVASTSAAFVSDASIELSDNSQGNIIEYNNVQWGAANGVLLKGNNNIVRHNYIGNFNYLGSYACPVELRGANDLIHNEIFNGGRDAIRGGGNGSDCGYNDIHHSNLINDDCGAIYTCCGTYGYTRIHHNWMHDISSRDEHFSSYKATGVYLDNSTKNIIVDHNVMWNLEWSCIQINWEGENQLLYNNTLWSNSSPNSGAMARWVNGYDIINVKLYNTLSNKGAYESTNEKNSVKVNLDADIFEDFENRNFMPTENSPAVDAGRTISGYTEGYTGSAPDAGAYERGATPWVAGPNWSLTDKTIIDSLAFSSHFDFTLTGNDTYKIPLKYYAQTTRNVKLSILNNDGNILAESIESIYKGTGTIYLDLKLDAIPEIGEDYKITAFLTDGDNATLFSLEKALSFSTPVPPTELVLFPLGNQALEIGDYINYEISTLPKGASMGVVWSSSEPSVAIMDENLNLMGLSEGMSIITATAYNGVSISFEVSVTVPLEERFLSKVNWEVIYADSESTQGFGRENRHKAIDGDVTTFWHTQWKDNEDPLPHDIHIDMKKSHLIEEVYYLPRQDDYGPNGTIGDYELYITNNANDWESAVATGTFNFPLLEADKSNLASFKERKMMRLIIPKAGRYMRLIALSEIQNKASIPFTAIAELDVIAPTSSSLKNNKTLGIGIYPNPVIDQLRFYGKEVHLITKIEIYSLAGQCMISRVVDTNRNIEVSQLSGGVYFLYGSTSQAKNAYKFIKSN